VFVINIIGPPILTGAWSGSCYFLVSIVREHSDFCSGKGKE
jgi:hypothetical protein